MLFGEIIRGIFFTMPKLDIILVFVSLLHLCASIFSYDYFPEKQNTEMLREDLKMFNQQDR